MATYPANPSLVAVTSTTAVDSDFLNQFVDNINAIGADLRILSDNDGSIDLAIDKGIKWATTLEIYMSGGDLVLDDDVNITGNLDVTGSISGTFSVSGGIDIPGTLTVDTINDSGAAKISVLETIEMGAGKGLQGNGVSELAILAGCNVTGNLDVSGTLTVDTINDSGAGAITVSEDLRLASGKYVDAPTGKFDTLYDSGAGQITVMDDLKLLGGSARLELTAHIDTPGDPAVNAAKMWVDFSSNLQVKIRNGGTTKTKTIMPFAPSAYTVTNDLTDRAYDANTVAIEELADVVGTIIADLQGLGLLG